MHCITKYNFQRSTVYGGVGPFVVLIYVVDCDIGVTCFDRCVGGVVVVFVIIVVAGVVGGGVVVVNIVAVVVVGGGVVVLLICCCDCRCCWSLWYC